MADTNTPKTPERSDSKQGGTQNQTMQHEQAKATVAGNDRKTEQGGFDQNRSREQGHSGEKSAIGGGKGQDQDRSQTGEPGRARSELDQDKSRSDFDKKPGETTGQR